MFLVHLLKTQLKRPSVSLMKVVWEERMEDWRGGGTGIVPEKHSAVNRSDSWPVIG